MGAGSESDGGRPGRSNPFGVAEQSMNLDSEGDEGVQGRLGRAEEDDDILQRRHA